MNNASHDARNGPGYGVHHDIFSDYPETNIQANFSIYENHIPPFAEIELERIYDNVYSTLARFHIYGAAENASTYVARRGQVIAAVFIFRKELDEVKVVNQQVTIDVVDISMFAKTIFSKYSSVKIISFYAISTEISRVNFPFQKFNALEENIIFLPATQEEYMASLSAKFRYNLRVSEKKLRKQFPSFRYEIFSKSEVSEQLIREIVRLAGERMAAKKKPAYLSEANIDCILRLVHAYGFVGIATIDGRICAGNIWYCCCKRNIMHVIAHDPAYDQYMLGNQMSLWSVHDCIARGGRECWLMGGGSAYKSRFLALPIDLDSVVIFRSRAHFLLNWRRTSTTVLRRWQHRTRKKLAQSAQGDGLLAPLVAQALALACFIKRFSLSIGGRLK